MNLYVLERSYGVTPDSVLGRSLDSVARHLEMLGVQEYVDRHESGDEANGAAS